MLWHTVLTNFTIVAGNVLNAAAAGHLLVLSDGTVDLDIDQRVLGEL